MIGVIISTSLQVAPVSKIPEMVNKNLPIILINRDVTGYSNKFDINLLGNVPKLRN